MNMVVEFIHRIASYAFLGRAFSASILIGVITGIIGAFVILRGLSLMGDAIGHAVLPGVATSHLVGVPPVIGAAVFGLIASLLIGFISDKTSLKKDTVMGLVFSSFFALGIVMISQIRTMTDLNSILFGNIITVSSNAVRDLLIIALGLILFVILFYKELLITSFDDTTAQVYGLNTKLIHYVFLSILTIVIVFSLQVVGAILIVAMIITPAATAYLLTNRMHVMIFISAGIGMLSGGLGMFLSITYNFSSGASIVLVSAMLFLLVFIFAPKKGLLVQMVK